MPKSKKHSFRELSEKRCVKCGRHIKLNVAERKPADSPLKCWRCCIMEKLGINLKVYKQYRKLRKGLVTQGLNPSAARQFITDTRTGDKT